MLTIRAKANCQLSPNWLFIGDHYTNADHLATTKRLHGSKCEKMQMGFPLSITPSLMYHIVVPRNKLIFFYSLHTLGTILTGGGQVDSASVIHKIQLHSRIQTPLWWQAELHCRPDGWHTGLTKTLDRCHATFQLSGLGLPTPNKVDPGGYHDDHRNICHLHYWKR